MTRTPSDAARASAASQPSTWIYEIDPWFDPDGQIPGWGVVGVWRSNDQGEIEGEFTANEDYRPSPVARGFRRPLSELESVAQLSVAGYIPPEQFAETVARSMVWVVQLAGHEGELSVAPSSEGKVVEVFSSPDLVPNGVLGDVPSHQLPFARVLELLPDDVRVALNPGTPPTLVLPDTGQ